MATIDRIAIGDTTYDINGAPVVSSLLMSTLTEQYNGNVAYSPFVSQLTTSEWYHDPVILAICGAEFIRQGISLWTELFLESRYFNGKYSTATTYYGMQERRTSPANTSAWYNLNLVDNLAIGQNVGSYWRPVVNSGQPYKIQRMRATLLIFGTAMSSAYELQNTVLSWVV